jgi:hypothetical protein
VDQKSKARVIYSVRPDATPEAELNALAAAYRFILFRGFCKPRGLSLNYPDDAVRRSGDK